MTKLSEPGTRLEPDKETDPARRLMLGMLVCLRERPYSDTRIIDIVTAAGMSKQTFYEHFTSKEDCFLRAYKLNSDLALAQMRALVEEPGDWKQRMTRISVAHADNLATYTLGANAVLREIKAAGPNAAAVRREVLNDWATLICDVIETHRGDRPNWDFAQMVVGGHDDYMTALLEEGAEPERLRAAGPVLADFLIHALS